MRNMKVKRQYKCEIITAGEVVEIAFQEESFVREEYEDVFIGNKIVEFQSEGVQDNEYMRVIVLQCVQ